MSARPGRPPEQGSWPAPSPTCPPTGAERALSALWDSDPLGASVGNLARRLPQRLDVDPQNADRGLAQLVLTLVDLLRQLMERQAIRRLEGGSLTDDQVEALGQAFMKMEARMEDLKAVFELDDEDLNLDLGPLGDLL